MLSSCARGVVGKCFGTVDIGKSAFSSSNGAGSTTRALHAIASCGLWRFPDNLSSRCDGLLPVSVHASLRAGNAERCALGGSWGDFGVTAPGGILRLATVRNRRAKSHQSAFWGTFRAMAGLVVPPSVPDRQGIEAWAWLALWIAPGRRPPLRATVQCAMCNGTG